MRSSVAPTGVGTCRATSRAVAHSRARASRIMLNNRKLSSSIVSPSYLLRALTLLLRASGRWPILLLARGALIRDGRHMAQWVLVTSARRTYERRAARESGARMLSVRAHPTTPDSTGGVGAVIAPTGLAYGRLGARIGSELEVENWKQFRNGFQDMISDVHIKPTWKRASEGNAKMTTTSDTPHPAASRKPESRGIAWLSGGVCTSTPDAGCICGC